MISLVTICQHQSYQIFFLVMRTFKIYFLSTFEICNTVLLTIVTMLYILHSHDIYFIYL